MKDCEAAWPLVLTYFKRGYLVDSTAAILQAHSLNTSTMATPVAPPTIAVDYFTFSPVLLRILSAFAAAVVEPFAAAVS